MIFAGFGFVWGGLYETWGQVPRTEYLCIWLITLLTALMQLLYAVLAGVALAFAVVCQ